MSKTPPRTVKETGASSGDLLVGITPRNMGLVVQVNVEQEPGEGGRLRGPLTVIHWGIGSYAEGIREVCTPSDFYGPVDDFIDLVTKQPGCSDFAHGLNANGLWRLDAQSIADEIIHSPKETA